MSLLLAQDLTKRIGNRQILQGVSVSIESGQIVGLLGPNGAGKTTCFYTIVGLIPSNSGRIWLDKKEITDHPMHMRARMGVGYLPQEPSVFRKLTVQENLMGILQTRHTLTREQQQQKCEQLMEEFHLTHIRNSLGISLSGGERRRVEIARALSVEPKFILLDEPFAGVDPISVVEIQKIIKHLTEQDIGILITDHNVRETLGICQRAYILNAGKVIAMGDAQAILANEQVKEVYLGGDFRL